MHRRLAWLLVALIVSACVAARASPSAVTGTAGSGAPTAPIVECLGGLTPATCDQVAPAVLAAVAPSGWAPTHLWINSGMLCSRSDCLFDPDQNFPMPTPPQGGSWIANAEVAFAGTDQHAGLNVAAVGSHVVPVLIGYRVPLLTWCSGSCPSSAVTDGPFRFELVLPHLGWKASDPISGDAILSFDGAAPTTVYGSGGGVIVFSYDEVGGNRHVGYVMDAVCAPHEIDPATPLNVPLAKSGAVNGTEPDAEFLRSFLADPQVHLPAGTWDITAYAMFVEAPACAGGTHTLKATVRITVTG